MENGTIRRRDREDLSTRARLDSATDLEDLKPVLIEQINKMIQNTDVLSKYLDNQTKRLEALKTHIERVASDNKDDTTTSLPKRKSTRRKSSRKTWDTGFVDLNSKKICIGDKVEITTVGKYNSKFGTITEATDSRLEIKDQNGWTITRAPRSLVVKEEDSVCAHSEGSMNAETYWGITSDVDYHEEF